MQEEKNENETGGDIYSRWTNLSVFLYTEWAGIRCDNPGFQIAKFSFDDCGDMTLHQVRKKKGKNAKII